MNMFKGIARVSRVGVLGVLGLFGAGVVLGGCEVQPEESDAEKLFSEEPEVDEQGGECGICLGGYCIPLGGGYCCAGQMLPTHCGLQSSPDVWGQLPAEGGHVDYAVASYGSTDCHDSYVIGYPEQAPEDYRWLKEVVVSVPPPFAPTNECDCINTRVMVEWEEDSCLWGPPVKGVPPLPLCNLGQRIARKGKNGVWGPNGCTVSVTVTPDDAPGSYFFAATAPQLRATAMDKRSAQERPILVRTYRH